MFTVNDWMLKSFRCLAAWQVCRQNLFPFWFDSSTSHFSPLAVSDFLQAEDSQNKSGSGRAASRESLKIAPWKLLTEQNLAKCAKFTADLHDMSDRSPSIFNAVMRLIHILPDSNYFSTWFLVIRNHIVLKQLAREASVVYWTTL